MNSALIKTDIILLFYKEKRDLTIKKLMRVFLEKFSKSFPFCDRFRQTWLGSRDRPWPLRRKFIGPPVHVLYTYIFLDGLVVLVCGTMFTYTLCTYLSFTIDLSQAPEIKVGVCSHAYQYDAHDRRPRRHFYVTIRAFTILWLDMARNLRVPSIKGKILFYCF